MHVSPGDSLSPARPFLEKFPETGNSTKIDIDHAITYDTTYI